ncbi:S-adenosyl-L-methionine-dependent methyltransferase [Wilcoxina mikolae CBS 423.85]|nr:S-adenosyl-L-methionine-dependent methyltransferase [Wilcoxina mikolae CBS 423.85]
MDNLISTHYTTHITSSSSSQNPSSAAHNSAVAAAFGYSPSDLSSTPASSNLGVSCGNPLAMSGLREGETLLDLGSGGGMDCFLASPRVGKTGHVYGIDMTSSMISLSNRNKSLGSYENVTFINAHIKSIPLPASIADIVTSNCVINLVPSIEKPAVFTEIFRLLKPGGRVAISDILARKELPEEVRRDVGLFVGCVGGASKVGEYEGWIREAGFKDVFIIDTEKDVNIYKESLLVEGSGGEEGIEGTYYYGSPSSRGSISSDRREILKNLDLNEYVGAYQIYAIKPEQAESAELERKHTFEAKTEDILQEVRGEGN